MALSSIWYIMTGSSQVSYVSTSKKYHLLPLPVIFTQSNIKGFMLHMSLDRLSCSAVLEAKMTINDDMSDRQAFVLFAISALRGF